MSESLKGLHRTCRCAEVSQNEIGKEVTVCGWVQKIRNKGGLIFIDLRDRSGIVQILLNEETADKDLYHKASTIKQEYVLAVVGIIEKRGGETNDKIATGSLEIIPKEIRILAECDVLPFQIEDETNTREELRLKYRYLDLRRPCMQKFFITKSKITQAIREYMISQDFLELETPILAKSTPEGARDYLVPSRLYEGEFYALPQSPQIFKQLYMIAGFERYFQIARCFRDEDLRADRQPEFTQIDIEQSFSSEEDIWATVEGLMKKIFKEIKDVDLEPFPRLTYNECMDRFGSDKPDTRFGMEIKNITHIFEKTFFEVFSKIIADGGEINAIVLKGLASTVSRKEIDKLTDFVKVYKAKALSYLKYNDKELSGSIIKIMSPEEQKKLIKELELEDNDMVFIVADKKAISKTALGALRIKLARDNHLIPEDKFNFLWVTEFPMFEYSEEENRFVAAHHPFTSPRKEDMDKLLTDKENCYSRAYDLVLNGYELLSGSVRIHDSETQAKVFEAIDMTPEEAQEKFGFFLEAFKYGAPPHCGVGIGLERLVMILANTDNIREVVAFPKTASAQDLMNEAPGKVTQKQLDELGLKLK
jgi:aspartyl-tRNA synthetase